MTWIARNEQMYQLPIHECFLKLEKSIPEGGYCCWENLLYEQWLSFPFLFDSEKERMNQRLKELNKD